MKAYSDPGYFIEQWVASQARLREEVRAHRVAKRMERENKRKLEEQMTMDPKGNNNNAHDSKRPVRMHTHRYNVHTGEKELLSSPRDQVKYPLPFKITK